MIQRHTLMKQNFKESPKGIAPFRCLAVMCLLIVLHSSCSYVDKQDAEPAEVTIFSNQKDYSFMWWKKTIKTGNQIFAIKTNNYALSFDYPNLSIEDFSINKDPGTAASVLKETNDQSFPSNSAVDLRLGWMAGDSISWIDETSGKDDDCQLIETGKYFQRRFITNLPEFLGGSPFSSGLEISSWPDRVAFILKATLDSDMKKYGLVTELTFPEEYSTLLENGEIKAFKNPKNGSGFIIMKSANASSMTIEGSTLRVSLQQGEVLTKGTEINSGMIIYPVGAEMDTRLEEIAQLENKPLKIKATQTAPTQAELNVEYDKDKGWYQIELRSDNTESDKPPVEPGESNPGPQDDKNQRIERVEFSVHNPSDKAKVVRLNFAKGRLLENGAKVFGVSGISAVLRDLEGNPVGVPVQLSKNWHTGGRSGVDDHYFRGTWYHGLTMLTIPADTTLTLEYTSVNSMWGQVPAASHAQLCLVGWGHNQQWDESAIGSWGETLTYEPDLDQTGAPVLDFRPLLVESLEGKKWGWTGNIGGADIFNYTKMDGNKGWHSRIRTDYKKYSPNLTEVTYAGVMDDNSMDFEYTASLGRSDDLVRGIYKVKLDVLEDVSFKDFVIFQVAAADYHHVKSKTLTWGNETGQKKQWESTVEGTPRYITDKKPADGKVIWFSFTDSEYTSPQQLRFKLANRGFIIREWKAKMNGQENVQPWFAEYKTAGGDYGDPSGIINITPPAGTQSFQKGDYVEAEIVLLAIPLSADDYYGPNLNFENALLANSNTWKMVYREAVGNDLDVIVSTGRLVDSYPIKIEAGDDKAAFSVSGGLGYVPLTITGVRSYLQPELFESVDGKWQKIDQSIHGNDFWQTDFNQRSETWDITYNLDLDTPNDQRLTREFRFEMSGN